MRKAYIDRLAFSLDGLVHDMQGTRALALPLQLELFNWLVLCRTSQSGGAELGFWEATLNTERLRVQKEEHFVDSSAL